MSEQLLRVREMRPDEVRLRVDYFHDATDDYLAALGVGRHLLPDRDAWAESMRVEAARPLPQRVLHALVWEVDGEVVGFSTADRIAFGEDAFMHLHVLAPDRRGAGLGTRFVRLSADEYFRALRLARLASEPNALNTAPNRTLQRAGFRYVGSRACTPGPINVPQVVTRWVLERPAGRTSSDSPRGADRRDLER